MPQSAKKACQFPGCKNSARSMYCSQHSTLSDENRLGRDKKRGSAHSRGYNRQHQKWRLLVLRRDPICKIARFCEGFAQSTEADHIKPIRAGGERFSLSNGQGACKSCHAWKTATEDSYFSRRKKVWAIKSLQIDKPETPLLPPDTPPRN